MSGDGCTGRGISKFTIGEFLPAIEIRNSDTIIQHFASAWLRGQIGYEYLHEFYED
jgi:hypothetical protein